MGEMEYHTVYDYEDDERLDDYFDGGFDAPVWITKDGRAIPMPELGLRHLLNCILYLERAAREYGKRWASMLDESRVFQHLLDEAEARRIPLPHVFGR